MSNGDAWYGILWIGITGVLHTIWRWRNFFSLAFNHLILSVYRPKLSIPAECMGLRSSYRSNDS